MELHELTLAQALDTAGQQAKSPRLELTQALLERMEATEDRVKAYLTFTPEAGPGAGQGRRGPGPRPGRRRAPCAACRPGSRTCFAPQGVRTTCGSKILE